MNEKVGGGERRDLNSTSLTQKHIGKTSSAASNVSLFTKTKAERLSKPLSFFKSHFTDKENRKHSRTHSIKRKYYSPFVSLVKIMIFSPKNI